MKVSSASHAYARRPVALALLLAGGIGGLHGAHAETWSDTSLSWRYGTSFAEPFDNNADGSHKDITKNIVAFTHAGGYTYGTQFFNVDYLLSNGKDPADGVAGKPGAQEAYAVYRNTVDFSKVFKANLAYAGIIRSAGMEFGFDVNTKNDGYGSKKRMLVVGPTIMLDTPGFLNVSALAFFESNAPNGIDGRYSYKTHPALEAVWGIPIMDLPLSFEGYGQWIAAKGKNEFGGSTSPEFHVDTELMYDIGSEIGLGKHKLRVGAEYEYWHNKFGNTSNGNSGATARTPMVRVDYHF